MVNHLVSRLLDGEHVVQSQEEFIAEPPTMIVKDPDDRQTT